VFLSFGVVATRLTPVILALYTSFPVYLAFALSIFDETVPWRKEIPGCLNANKQTVVNVLLKRLLTFFSNAGL